MNHHPPPIIALLTLTACLLASFGGASELLNGPLKPGVQKPRPPAPSAQARPKTLPQYSIPARYRGTIVRGREAELPDKVIALTFDDGPNPALTPLVLKTLAQYKAKATFFVLGEWAQEWPQLIAQEAAAGHAIESHSYSHPNEDLSVAHARRELERTATIIEQTAGAKPRLFRPPYGYLHWSMPKVAAQQGYCVVKWTICASDRPTETIAEIVDTVLKSPQSGDIVLLHDGRGHIATARALPEIMRRLSAKGFRFVTVPELLRLWDKAKGSPRVVRKPRPTPAKGAA